MSHRLIAVAEPIGGRDLRSFLTLFCLLTRRMLAVKSNILGMDSVGQLAHILLP